MQKRKKIVALVLAIMLILSLLAISASASLDASEYIREYYAGISRQGGGKLKISFDIQCKAILDDVGARWIRVYEYDGTNSTLVKTFDFTNADYSYIMAYNVCMHGESVIFNGTEGHVYYAIVKFYAGDTNGGDSRTYTTSTVIA